MIPINIPLNAKLGDGSINHEGPRYRAVFRGVQSQWIEYKHRVSGATSNIYKCKPSRNSYAVNPSYQFTTRSNPEFGIYKNMPIVEAVSLMQMNDLVALYLDDGSWHKKLRVMHLYKSSFDLEETEALRDKVFQLLGSQPSIYTERKVDKRQFYYLYFPRSLTDAFKGIVEDFLFHNGLDCFYYKIGKEPPERDIRVNSCTNFNQLRLF